MAAKKITTIDLPDLEKWTQVPNWRPIQDAAVLLPPATIPAPPEKEPPQISVSTVGLTKVSRRPPLLSYLRQLWERRYFTVADSRAKAFQTTRGTLLGKIWLIVRPFLDSLIYFVIFGLLLGVNRNVPNFLAYLVVGVSFFSVVQSGLGTGSAAVNSSQNMIRAFMFPRAAVVLSWLLRSILDFIPVAVATLLFVVVVPPHVFPSFSWLLIIPSLALGFLFSFGLALLTSSLTARLPDLKFIWPLIARFWFYLSCVFFSIDRFADHPLVYAAMQANPGYVFLKINRDLIVYNTYPNVMEWLYFAAFTVVLCVLGFVVFWSQEEEYGQDGI